MSKTFVIFGRQPKLGLAEIESLFGADSIETVGHVGAVIDKMPSNIDFSALGGTVKFGKLLTTLGSNKWQDVEKFLIEKIPEHAAQLDKGKLKLGLSAYELHVNAKQLLATGLKIKKALKTSGRSCRLVPNKEPFLNSAQVLHNQLTSTLGWELLLVSHQGQTYIGQTIAVQDIEAYGARDHGRPKRDAKVGMLPPKLAQIIINLADPKPNSTILDPFCGTGVVLQEAILMGHNAYGSDIEPRMIAYSEANIDWLRQTRTYLKTCDPKNNTEPKLLLETASATEHRWKTFDTIASETYLGRAFSALPDQQVLEKVVQDVNTITTKFLQNVAKQTDVGFRMCIAVPAWKTKNGFKHLPALDSLEKLGYTRAVFVNARDEDLIYHRDNQVVARELVVLIRK